MLGVLAAVSDLGVQAFDAFLVPGTLGSGDPLFESSVPAGGATQAADIQAGRPSSRPSRHATLLSGWLSGCPVGVGPGRFAGYVQLE